MLTSQTITVISPEELLEKALEMKSKQLRLIQISCTKKDGFEISYTFDNNYNTENLRLHIPMDAQIESIGHIYNFAFLYENEIKDLFGVKINNLTIDFKGNLYRTHIKTPFSGEA